MNGLSLGLSLDRSPRRGGGVSPPPPLALTDGLLAFYRFDGNGNDSSGNSRNMTMTGDGYEPGLIGQSLSTGFGTATIPLTSGVWSLSVWVKTPTISQSDFGGILEFNDPFAGQRVFELFGESGDLPVMQVLGGAAAYEVPDENWVHVAIVCNADTEQVIYINGVAVQTLNVTTTIPEGKISCIAETDFSSPFDLVGVWNRLLTSGEVATLYNGGDGFDPTPPPVIPSLVFNAARNSQYLALRTIGVA